jgi:hook assembly protein, flagella
MKISNLFKAAAILALGLNLHAKTIKEGVLTVATEGTYAPFLFCDEKGKLTERINKALAELKAEGKLKEISQKYFGKDVSE